MHASNFIIRLDGNLRMTVTLLPVENTQVLETDLQSWLLNTEIFDGTYRIADTSFTLHAYSASEAEDLARNIRSNPVLMRAIDDELAGDMD
jgi:hypothetical protein